MDEKRVLAGVYKYLARRIRTEKEIKDWLTSKEVDSELQETVIEKLKKLKLINDYEYACSFIRTRNLLKPKPKKVLRMELLRKGISEENIKEALQFIGVDEASAAKLLVEKNKWKWERYEGEEKKRKISEFLMRKGFGWSEVKEVLG